MKKVLYFIVVLLIGCKTDTQPKTNVLKGNVFGTYYIIKYGNSSQQNINIQPKIDSVFNAINKSLNTYIPNSDISKINKGDTSVVTDKLFQDVFNLSKKYTKNRTDISTQP